MACSHNNNNNKNNNNNNNNTEDDIYSAIIYSTKPYMHKSTLGPLSESQSCQVAANS